MSNLKEKFSSHLAEIENYPEWKFVVELTFWAFFFKIIFALIFGALFVSLGIYTEPDIAFELDILRKGLLGAIVFTTLFAGFETVIGQWLILSLSSLVTKNTLIKILLSATVFSLLHIDPLTIFIVFPIGVILAWSFLIKKKKSTWNAFFLTTLIHALHNLLALLMLGQSSP